MQYHLQAPAPFRAAAALLSTSQHCVHRPAVYTPASACLSGFVFNQGSQCMPRVHSLGLFQFLVRLLCKHLCLDHECLFRHLEASPFSSLLGSPHEASACLKMKGLSALHAPYGAGVQEQPPVCAAGRHRAAPVSPPAPPTLADQLHVSHKQGAPCPAVQTAQHAA